MARFVVQSGVEACCEDTTLDMTKGRTLGLKIS
jgi:hypothetical protein